MRKHLHPVCSIGKGWLMEIAEEPACWRAGSLARLVDVLVDVLSRGQLRNTRLGLLVRYLSSCRCEVLIALNRPQNR